MLYIRRKPVKKIISILLSISCLLGLVSCGSEAVEEGIVLQAYYINSSETRVEIHDITLKSETTQGQIEELLTGLAATPEKLEYKAPLAMGFQVKEYKLENGTLTLDVDENYNNMFPTTEILVRAALVCSLTQIEDVNYVNITVEGNPLYDNLQKLVGAMNADQFVNNMGSEISSYDTANLVLYFTNASGDGLIAINRTKPYNTNISLDRLVVEELIAGPSTTVEGVYPTINPETKPLSVMTKDGICYVNLDENFLNQIYNVSADVVIYSIVNSLAELSNVNKVQISINGDTSGVYREKYSFSTVFERNLDLVTTLEQ